MELNITIIGQGTVSKTPDKSSYDAGESVILTPTPLQGWEFSHWSGDISGNETPKTIIMLQSLFNVFWNEEVSGDELVNTVGDNIPITGKDFATDYIPATSAATFLIDGDTYTVAQLIDTDYNNILVKYDNQAPHHIRMIGVLKPEYVDNLTQEQLDTLHEVFDLWIWWSGDWNDYGVMKENRNI